MSIEKMKKVSIISETSDRRFLLDTIKKLGVVHISEKCAESGEVLSVKKDEWNIVTDAIKVLENLPKVKDKNKNIQTNTESINDPLSFAKEILELNKRKNELNLQKTSTEKYLSEIALWDNVSESELLKLTNTLVKITLVKCDKKTLKSKECKDVSYIPTISKNNIVLIVGDNIPNNAQQYTLFGKDINKEKESLNYINAKIDEINNKLLEYVPSSKVLKDYAHGVLDVMEYEGHFESMKNNGTISYLTGYIPISSVASFKETLDSKKSFAYMIDDAKGDEVPTLLKTNKYTNMLSPVLGILGISPGYEEKDISFWFLSFFALFFALIIGDAAYGLIILIIGLVLLYKQKKFNPLNKLVIMLGALTLIWGALTGTWFGSVEILNALSFLKKMVVPAFTNFPSLFGVTDAFTQNSMMRLSFSLGALQLCLACVLNVIQKIKVKDLSLIADIGWFSSILSLYFLALMLVVGQSFPLLYIIVGVAVGFVLVLLFGGFEQGISFGKGIKKSLAGAFSAFLNTISAFGNVMSYIRLFAVGIASVAISESFNGLASGMLHGPFIIFGILILVVGHTLNLVLGLLSVVVHGIRLNVMEFSSQCGIEWAGVAYRPFK